MRLAVGDARRVDHSVEALADAQALEHCEGILADRGQAGLQARRAHRLQGLEGARQQVAQRHGGDQFLVVAVLGVGQAQLLFLRVAARAARQDQREGAHPVHALELLVEGFIKRNPFRFNARPLFGRAVEASLTYRF
jgi:hypothetical protein